MEKKILIVPWISLFCFLMGMMLSFCSAFGCQIHLGRHVLPSVFIAGVVLFLIVQLKGKYAILFSVIGFLLLTAYIVVNFASLEREFQIILHYINEKAKAYNGKVMFYYPSTHGAVDAMDSNTLFRIVGIFFAVFISFFLFRLHSRTYGLIPVYLVVALGLLVGKAPDGRAISFLAVGTVLAYAWVARQERGGKHFFVQKKVGRRMGFVPVYLVVAAILVLGLSVAKQAGIQQEDKILSYSEEYLKRQHKFEKEVKRVIGQGAKLIRGRMGIDGTGKMTNETPRYQYKTVMRMTVPSRPTSDFLLRGFVGGSYQNGKWSPCDTEKLHKQISVVKLDEDLWNSSYDFLNYFIMWEEKESVLNGYQGRKMQVSLEYVGKGKWGECAYVPYFSDIYSIKDGNRKSCVAANGENGFLKEENFYRLDCYNIGENNYNDITEQVRRSYQNIMFSNGKQTTQQREMAVNTMSLDWYYCTRYLAYISENYAGIPEGTLQGLKNFVKAHRISGRMDSEINIAEWKENLIIARIIQMILEQQAEYSTDLPALPEGKDYAEYFLLESKKGYCEHFATAGTLMLRAEQIPARYVSGFKVTPDMFQKNEDGSYTAEILDSDAHAWTEVYVGEYAGWFPVDMTPAGGQVLEDISGGDLKSPSPTPVPTPVKDTEEPETVTPSPTAKQTAAPSPTKMAEQHSDKNGKSFMGKGNIGIKAVLFIAGLISFCLLALAGRIISLRFCAVKYRRELFANRKNRNECIKILVEYFLHFLKLCGMRGIDKQHENDWCRRVAYACVERYPSDDWDGFKEVIQKAAFAEEDVSGQEFAIFCERMQEARKHILQKQGKYRRRFLWLAGFARDISMPVSRNGYK